MILLLTKKVDLPALVVLAGKPFLVGGCLQVRLASQGGSDKCNLLGHGGSDRCHKGAQTSVACWDKCHLLGQVSRPNHLAAPSSLLRDSKLLRDSNGDTDGHWLSHQGWETPICNPTTLGKSEGSCADFKKSTKSTALER